MFEVWWAIQQPLYYGFTVVEYAGERIFKICEHLAKLQARSD